MTIENCYQTLGGDYQDVRSRIPSDALIKRFIGAFLSDPSFAALESAASAGDRKAAFSAVPAISIDYAVMEKTARAAVVPASIGWSDLGSWAALWEAAEKDGAGNATPRWSPSGKRPRRRCMRIIS